MLIAVGPDIHAASPNRSHAVPWMPVIFWERPAQDNVTPCDKNTAKLEIGHFQTQEAFAVPGDPCWTPFTCSKIIQIPCSDLHACYLFGKTCTG